MIYPSVRSRRHGFSIVEIIVVVAILTVAAVLSAPYIAGMAAAARLRTAADAVQNRLLEAQSLAILFNTDAELRFYEAEDLVGGRFTLRKLRILTLRPPEDDSSDTTSASVFEPVGAITSLDQEIEISTDSVRSSIMDLGFQDSTTDIYGRYIALRFHSDGSPALQSSKPWFLTLHEKDAQLRDPRLRNFVTVQIDPATGRLRSFQP